MTGYGSASKDLDNGKYTVELKSLNSKFLELNIKLPKAFSDKEFFLRNECSKLLERGKVMLSITAETTDLASKAATINKELLKYYHQELKSVADDLKSDTQQLMSMAVNFPEVVKFDEQAVSEEEWKQMLNTFYVAVKNFQTFRLDEGAVLEKDLISRIESILNLMSLVERDEPNRVPAIKEKLNTMLADAVGKENVDQNRLEQELIYYIDKLDITEEKVRLKSHCNYFIETLKDKDANGKKLGFISQEIGREINTMGSKANDAIIQRYVVGMKEELEKIKEQLLNVL
ncbi:MAG: YicC family protein [Bacteroidetes bacterium]|nr:YicC family protein [Bacteroidota bacterium]MBU1485907.1 YicC family protein [Bacteroidota bacterium]MBU2046837.1 YicC family protein [Bacteroidota bacterium]MBU2269360.1 YicC family protein [Bacteroidota bacterium]MBU2375909.1 YicC family protein [Bacteroidota bacterium]